MYRRRECSGYCQPGSVNPGLATSFRASQTAIVFVIVLLQNRAIHRLFPAARAGNVLLSKCSVGTAVITKQWKVFWNILCLFHAYDRLLRSQLMSIATTTPSHEVPYREEEN
jgi:hypothetical protein